MVEVPDYVAQRLARALRGEDVTAWTREERDAMANLLDPKPPTLREKVVDWLLGDSATRFEIADAVLAVIADELAKRPLVAPDYNGHPRQNQRDFDVAWLRGEQS